MKKVNSNEIRNIDGGARYEKTCPYCNRYTVGTTYIGWSSLSKNMAIIVVNSKLRNHMYSCISRY